LISYGMPKIVETIGKDDAKKLEEKFKLFNVENTTLSDGTKGTLGIQFMSDEEMADKKGLQIDIEAEEERNFADGRPYEKIILSYGRLDRISYDVEVIPESLWQSSQALNIALTLEKTAMIQKFFPEYFANNKELLFRDIIKNYNDDASKYNLPKPMNFAEEQGLELAQGMAGKKKGAGGGTSAGGGLISDITATDTNNT